MTEKIGKSTTPWIMAVAILLLALLLALAFYSERKWPGTRVDGSNVGSTK